jgi:hypothetical protein
LFSQPTTNFGPHQGHAVASYSKDLDSHPVSKAPPPLLSQEEIEFNEQFQKWEKEFDQWKKANVNHPDKEAYKRYEDQFELVRAQLLKVRQRISTNFIDHLN